VRWLSLIFCEEADFLVFVLVCVLGLMCAAQLTLRQQARCQAELAEMKADESTKAARSLGHLD
jgi:hypothetical protein